MLENSTVTSLTSWMILSNELFSSNIFFGKSSIDCGNVSRSGALAETDMTSSNGLQILTSIIYSKIARGSFYC